MDADLRSLTYFYSNYQSGEPKENRKKKAMLKLSSRRETRSRVTKVPALRRIVASAVDLVCS